MLDHAQVSVSTLLVWFGLGSGVGMVAAGWTTEILLLSHLGLISTIVTCAHAIRRAIVDRDEALRAAFTAGRDHERLQSVRAN